MTNVDIYPRETETKKVLNFLFSIGQPVTLREIEEDTGLSNQQIRSVLSYLGKMNKVTRNYEWGKAKKGSPPRRLVKVSLEGSQVANAKRVLDKFSKLKEFFDG